ncbi:glycosyltransferase family 2 protein [Buttiauxella sp. WJP83]|uniref:glycosyltransferase family 2 protein n=1 Tax=Buttiauxella sp. WJP83 TaxID=2986951 RepID=UPI0022DD5CE3|nr:glycosyltransferase family 2 protein [Buttiauxella sp. WJP83]WBM72089.1 glycosyltransferase family 2 protein [Buttiauxella sp. WJP83]
MIKKNEKLKIAVVIPCYKVKDHILDVISNIGDEVDTIYAVDDKCPESSGQFILDNCTDSRVQVLFNNVNKGVGGAVIHGYQQGLVDGIDIFVKVDGDGQMDPALIKYFVKPILRGAADYTKGNRFHEIEGLKLMPKIRLFGNAVLSFMTKFSSGYYRTFDPTNGYTAISSVALKKLPLEKISNRYFFESDMLFRLNIVDAKVLDIPMDAIYGDEVSNLNIKQILFPFLKGNIKNLSKRIFYNYFLRGFSIASVELVLGIILFIFGLIYGSVAWYDSIVSDSPATSGTVMLAALPVILGVQFLLSFIQADIENQPTISLTRLLRDDIESD